MDKRRSIRPGVSKIEHMWQIVIWGEPPDFFFFFFFAFFQESKVLLDADDS